MERRHSADLDYELEIFPRTSDIPVQRHGEIIDLLNSIVATNWKITTPHWSAQDSPFQTNFGMVLARHAGEIVGFSVYQRMNLDGIPVIYRGGTELLPGHQGRGAQTSMREAILRTEWAQMPEAKEIYYALRTRNPVVWSLMAKLCKTVIPSPDDQRNPVLEQACVRVAREFYPNCPVETPSMIMRNAYGHITYHDQPMHKSNDAVNDWIQALIPNPADAVFCLGVLRRPHYCT